MTLFFFFFSSRRRHTRFDCDWSSDVCSSDLIYHERFARHGVPNDRAIALQHPDGNGDVNQTLVCGIRSEEHTSELQSQSNLVCRLLLEKKKKRKRKK